MRDSDAEGMKKEKERQVKRDKSRETIQERQFKRDNSREKIEERQFKRDK